MEPPSQGARLNEGLLKELSGGDELQLRDLYQPSGKARAAKATIFIVCNDVDADRISTSEAGIADRVAVIPYPRVPVVDPDMIATVTEDVKARQAMVALLVRKCASMAGYRNPPKVPLDVLSASMAHREESLGDIGVWLKDNYVAVADKSQRIPVKTVREAAAQQFPAQDSKAVGAYSQRAFSALVLNAIDGLDKAKKVSMDGRPVQCYIGLRRRTEDEIEALAAEIIEAEPSEEGMAMTRYDGYHQTGTVVIDGFRLDTLEVDETVINERRVAQKAMQEKEPDALPEFYRRVMEWDNLALRGGFDSGGENLEEDLANPEFWAAVATAWQNDAVAATQEGREYFAHLCRWGAECAWLTVAEKARTAEVVR